MNSGTNKKLALAAMICAVAMTFIDQTIVSIAVPELQKDLHLSESAVQWVINGYLVALAALFAFGGRIADIAGHKRMVLIGIGIFAGASALCGATPDGSIAEPWMIFWRVVQGAGAAIMFPAALAIVVAAYPQDERGKAMAAFFGIAGGLTAIGPLAGGFLIEISWRTIFWINVPVAIAAVLLTLRSNPDDTRHPAKLDYRGAVLSAGGLGLLVLGLQQASSWGWDSPATIGAIIVGLILIGLFIRTELATEPPLMQVRIFANKAFAADNLVLFLISIAFVPMFLFASMYSQISLGFSASNAGLYIGIFFAGFVIASQWGGRMLDQGGARRPVLLGCAIAAVGFYLWAESMPDLSSAEDWNQWWRMMIAGAGTGLILGPITTDALNRAGRASYGEVTGITQTARNVGASVGLAILGTILISQNRINIEDSFEKLGATKAQADAVAGSLTQSGGGQASDAISQAGSKAQQFFEAVQSSFAHSSQTIFYGMAIAMALAFIVTLVRVPAGQGSRGGDQDPAGHWQGYCGRQGPEMSAQSMAGADRTGRAAEDPVGVVSSAVHPRELAAGHVDDLAVDVVGVVGAEQQDRSGRLLRLGGAAERDHHLPHLPHLLGDPELDLLALTLDLAGVLLGGGEARLDEAEGDGIAVDLELTPLLGDGLGQAGHPGLGGGVVGLAGVAHRARDRGDVDDLAEDLPALGLLGLGRLAPGRGERADHAERDDRVDVEHRLELLVAHPVDDAVPGVPGVVDDAVDRPEGFDRGRDELVGGAGLGQVAAEDGGLAVDLARRLLGDIAVDVVDQDLGALADEQLRRRPADAAGRARDDRRLAVEKSHSLALLVQVRCPPHSM